MIITSEEEDYCKLILDDSSGSVQKFVTGKLSDNIGENSASIPIFPCPLVDSSSGWYSIPFTTNTIKDNFAHQIKAKVFIYPICLDDTNEDEFYSSDKCNFQAFLYKVVQSCVKILVIPFLTTNSHKDSKIFEKFATEFSCLFLPSDKKITLAEIELFYQNLTTCSSLPASFANVKKDSPKKKSFTFLPKILEELESIRRKKKETGKYQIK